MSLDLNYVTVHFIIAIIINFIVYSYNVVASFSFFYFQSIEFFNKRFYILFAEDGNFEFFFLQLISVNY